MHDRRSHHTHIKLESTPKKPLGDQCAPSTQCCAVPPCRTTAETYTSRLLSELITISPIFTQAVPDAESVAEGRESRFHSS